jgi:integrase
MGSPSYLLKKHDTYYFRQACDQFLKNKIGKREIVKSLGVKEKSVAVRMAREFKVNLDYIIDYLGTDKSADVINAVQYLDDCFFKIKSQYISTKNIKCTPSVVPTTMLQPPTFQPIQADFDQSPTVATGPPADTRTKIKPLFEKYSLEKIRLKQWSPKTQKERASHIDLILGLLEYIKESKELYVENITIKDVRKIKELLPILPKNHNKFFPKYALPVLLEKCKALEQGNMNGLSKDAIVHLQDKISINTIADKYVSTIRGFWNWLNQQDYSNSKVFDVLRYDYKKVTNSWKTFSASDLTNLFNDRIFTNHKYQFSYQYFVPILSLYTSARLQEICQLRVSDIDIVDDVNVINITNDDTTSLKTVSSQRTIPIHPDLISCGFLDHIHNLRLKNERFVFPELKNENLTTKVKRVSKWFNERYRVQKGLNKGFSFHSLRRTFINEMSKCGAADADIRLIIGHSPLKSDTLNRHYKDDLSVKDQYNLIVNHVKYVTCTFPWRL